METTIGLRERRQRLAETPAALRGIVAVLSDEALTFREAPAAWNVIEVLAHLIEAETHDWMPRVRIVLSDGGDKRFTPFDREAGAARYRGWSATQLLDGFESARGEALAALDALRLGPDDLRRTGIHPEFGAVTLDQLLSCWVTHDHAHLAQISRVLVRYFGRGVGPWTAYFSLLRERG